MTRQICSVLLAGALALGGAGSALAQSATTVGGGATTAGSATLGSGGSAAAGGTAASTLGLGAQSGDSRALGAGGSAAATQGRVKADTRVRQNPTMLRGDARAKAQQGGTWSRSRTQIRIRDGRMTTTTRSLAHQPGGAPARSVTRETVPLDRH
jgi:hypothetical protein